MIVVTTETVPGRHVVQTLGIVQGNTMRTRQVGRDWASKMKGLVGGEVDDDTGVLNEARRQAFEMMIEQARQLEADAVVGVRFATCPIVPGQIEFSVYGTAVVLEQGAPEPVPMGRAR